MFLHFICILLSNIRQLIAPICALLHSLSLMSACFTMLFYLKLVEEN